MGRPSAKRLLGAVAIVGSLATACGGGDDAEKAGELLAEGLAAHRDGKNSEAAEAYREVLRLDPQNKFAYYNLGLVEQSAKRPLAAEANYRLALGIDANFPPALFNLAIVRAEAGDEKEAIQLYRRVLAVKPTDARTHLNLGLLLQETGKDKEGKREIETAIALDPKLAARVPERRDPDD